MYGPNGICEDIVFDFLIRDGVTIRSATTEDIKIIKGIHIQPNQKPIAESNFSIPQSHTFFILKFFIRKND